MTNAEIVLRALQGLEAASTKKLFHAADVMWQVRRDGWQMTTDKARDVLKALTKSGSVETVKDGRRYFFRTVKR